MYKYKMLYTVTHMFITRQRFGKHIPEAYALNNRTSTARQRTNKHKFLRTEDGVFREVRAEEL
jgi:hypothetical protein